MVDVALKGLAAHIEEGTLQNWFVEEGDMVTEGDELAEIMTEDGSLTIFAPATGVLSEVYYDEGDGVAKGEVICSIDEDGDDEEEDDDDDDEDDDEEEEEKEDKE